MTKEKKKKNDLKESFYDKGGRNPPPPSGAKRPPAPPAQKPTQKKSPREKEIEKAVKKVVKDSVFKEYKWEDGDRRWFLYDKSDGEIIGEVLDNSGICKIKMKNNIGEWKESPGRFINLKYAKIAIEKTLEVMTKWREEIENESD